MTREQQRAVLSLMENDASLVPGARDYLLRALFESLIRRSAPPMMRLKDLGSIKGGGTPSTSNDDNFASDGHIWVTPPDLRDMEDIRVKTSRRTLTDAGLRASSAQLLPVGSVLFSSRAPIGYVGIAGTQLSTNQGIKSLIPDTMVDPEYVYCYLTAYAPLIQGRAPGVTFKEVSARQFGEISIPLPTIEEQHDLARGALALIAICRSLRKSLEERDRISSDLKAQLIQTGLYLPDQR